MPSLSIAMATYNGGPFIRAQLDSLANQSLRPSELVITDDGSSDNTLEEIRRFSATAPFPVSVHENPKNLGYARNFAKALGMTTGEIVFPCDQDDVWMPDKIARMVTEFEVRSETALILCDTLLCDGTLTPNGQTKLGQIRANGLPDTAHVMGCCIAVRRQLLDLALPQPEDAHAHDNWLVQIADELQISMRLERPLQYYRLHGKNASDFFVNSARKQTAGDWVRHKLRRLMHELTSPSGLAAEQATLALLYTHMAQRAEGFSQLCGQETYLQAIQHIGQKRDILARRMAIRSSNRLHRPSAILSLWREKGYGNSRRFMRALKDFVISG